MSPNVFKLQGGTLGVSKDTFRRKKNFDTTFSLKNPAIPSSRENSGFSPKISKNRQKKHEKIYKNSKIGEIKIDIKFFFIGGNGQVSEVFPAKTFFSTLS